ncbi:MAG: hypothetical protein M1828_001930 [Chrysothrix sp. TS-e1954]|nr:MAG: hypothetical protein M1828_001930 [Chrysothrix sp. TS-e1954]
MQLASEADEERASKRRKTHVDGDAHREALDGGNLIDTSVSPKSVPRHPLDVKPLGNLYDANEPNIKYRCGALAALPDELLMTVLECHDRSTLIKLGATCKALYAYCRADELWKGLFIESPPAEFSWRGSWRSTVLKLNRESETQISCHGLFSDVLYRPFFCAHTSLTTFAANVPAKNQIHRLENLSAAEFTSEWANKPFILTAPVKEWPVYQQWSTPHLLEKHAATRFRAEAVDWPLSTYVDYMQRNTDESPLYLFDCRFAEKMELDVGLDGDYWPPPCFGTDMFSVLGEQRPDSRWLIVGPEHSGSTFHKDPNATSAWNAVLRGSKYWIMFPSSSSIPPPPGVYVSADQSEVTSPLSIAEWLLGFHEEARATPLCKEGVCYEGEVLHVPSGWYHLVLNLEASIAVTQNFVPEAHLAAALAFMRDRSDQVSGFSKKVSNPAQLFEERLRATYPELLRKAEDDLSKRTEPVRKSAWECATTQRPEDGSGFSFGFGFVDAEQDG